jgi:M6 family metalloprotease-like protein
MRKNKIILLTTSCLFFITGCSNPTNPSVSESSSEQTVFNGYFKATSYKTSFRALQNEENSTPIASLGNVKLLVVPVQVKGEKEWTSAMISEIQATFFGAKEDTGWESVASYYEQASYGKLHFSGEVVAPVVSQADSAEMVSKKMNAPGVPALEFYNAASADLCKKYDIDSDGYIDATILVYSNTYQSTKMPWWAWTSTFNTEVNADKPMVHRFMWASYDFIHRGGYDKPDAHTFVHETGHLLGLNDYYSSYGPFNPTGGLTMMDHNILDFDAYSKMCLGWTYPYVATDECALALRPFATSGDCLLISNHWNGSPMDEYLLVEYYTPEGLNAQDSAAPYKGNEEQGFTKPGILIYHVDARIAQIYSKTVSGVTSYSFGKYVNNPDLSTGLFAISGSNAVSSYEYYERYGTNDWTDTEGGRYKEIHLMEATGTNTFQYGFAATNDTLFQEGSSFRPDKNFFVYNRKWNNHEYCPWVVTVDSVTSEKAYVSLSKVYSA